MDAWGSNFESLKQTIPSSQDLRTQADSAVMQMNTARLARVETMMCEINSKLELILDTMTKPAQQSAPAVIVETKAQPVSVETKAQPGRKVGISTQAIIIKWIEECDGGMKMFAKRAKAGFVVANLVECTPSEKKNRPATHRLHIHDRLLTRKFRPAIFGITEAREVVAYLEYLGVKVKTNGLI
jgi:hypothetical protein